MDRIPEVVEVGNLVGEELDAVENTGPDHHIGSLQDGRHLEPVESPGQAEEKSCEIKVETRRPACPRQQPDCVDHQSLTM